jgi:hypothetical protein
MAPKTNIPAPRSIAEFPAVAEARTKLSELRAARAQRQRRIDQHLAELEALKSPQAESEAIDAAAQALLSGQEAKFPVAPPLDVDRLRLEVGAYDRAISAAEEMVSQAEFAAAKTIKESFQPQHRQSGQAVARALQHLVAAVGEANKTGQLPWDVQRLAGSLRDYGVENLEFLVKRWFQEHGEAVGMKAPDFSALPQEEPANRLHQMEQNPNPPTLYQPRRLV